MPKLIMLKGLPASGKTTWAMEAIKAQPANSMKRVNKDDLRNMIDAGRYSKGAEQWIKKFQDIIVYQFLGDGHNVIVDNTHIEPHWEPHWRDLAKEIGATFILQDFTDIPMEECIARDKTRPLSRGYVGEEVIRTMAKRLRETTQEPTTYRDHNPDLRTAIIVDIDGTLADHIGIRGHHEYGRVYEDRVVPHIKELVTNLADTYDILLVSGRPDIARDETVRWLNDNFIVYDLLYMRTSGDYRADNIIKKELFEQHIEGRWNIEFVVDDRDRVVDMWRKELKIPCLQVNYGDF